MTASHQSIGNGPFFCRALHYGLIITYSLLRGPMIPLKAAVYRPHALYIFIKRVHLFIEPRLRRLHIRAAQLIECLTDGEFVYFSHRKSRAAVKQTGTSLSFVVQSRSVR